MFSLVSFAKKLLMDFESLSRTRQLITLAAGAMAFSSVLFVLVHKLEAPSSKQKQSEQENQDHIEQSHINYDRKEQQQQQPHHHDEEEHFLVDAPVRKVAAAVPHVVSVSASASASASAATTATITTAATTAASAVAGGEESHSSSSSSTDSSDEDADQRNGSSKGSSFSSPGNFFTIKRGTNKPLFVQDDDSDFGGGGDGDGDDDSSINGNRSVSFVDEDEEEEEVVGGGEAKGLFDLHLHHPLRSINRSRSGSKIGLSGRSSGQLEGEEAVSEASVKTWEDHTSTSEEEEEEEEEEDDDDKSSSMDSAVTDELQSEAEHWKPQFILTCVSWSYLADGDVGYELRADYTANDSLSWSVVRTYNQFCAWRAEIHPPLIENLVATFPPVEFVFFYLTEKAIEKRCKQLSAYMNEISLTKRIMISPLVFRSLMAFLTPDPDEEDKKDTRQTSSIGLHGEDLVHVD